MKNFNLHSLLSAPFRPFFLGCSFICAIVPMIWILVFNGHIDFNSNYSSTLSWHIHEMFYGFGGGILFGFLLTASSNWTGKAPVNGPSLLGLVSLWLMSRLLVFEQFPFMLTAMLNIIFAFSANYLFYSMVRSNRNKYIILPLTMIFSLSQALFIISDYIGSDFLYSWAIQVSIASIFHILLIMTGRLVPMFTRGMIGENILSPSKVNSYLAIGPVLLLYLPQEYVNRYVALVVYSVALMIHLQRCIQWKTIKTLKYPMVSILHLGQLLSALFFLSNILFHFGLIESSINIHFFTTGVFGVLAIAMLLRVSKGHTGRGFNVTHLDKFCFLSIIGAFLLRSPLAALAQESTEYIFLLAAILWMSGFGIYFITNLSALTRARH